MKEIKITVVCGALICSILGSFGCSRITPPVDKPQPVQRPTPEASKTTYFTHVIKWPGENLSRISRWYTGSDKNWRRILKANPSIDPKRINIGDSIYIPKDLMTTQKPMPKSYLAPKPPHKKKKTQAPAAPVKSAPKAEEIELFGPVDTAPQPSSHKKNDSSPALETID